MPGTPDASSSLLTTQEAAAHLNLSTFTICRRIKEGKLRAHFAGRGAGYRIAPEELERFKAALPSLAG